MSEHVAKEIVVDRNGRAVIHAGSLHLVIPLISLMAIACLIWEARGWKEELATRGDLNALRADVSTALAVLKDHGTEFATLRQNVANSDSRMNEMQQEMKARTVDRYTARDADRDLSLMRREIEANVKVLEARLSIIERGIK